MCDKLNTTAEVSSKINKVQAYYLLPMSDTNGNKELHSHIEGIFNREHKKAVRYSETELEAKALKQSPSKGKKANHGRKEFTDIELLPAKPYLDERIHNPHEGVTALVRKTKTTVKVLNEEISKTVKVTYYISSIFDEDYSIRQDRACFQNYWRLRRTILY